MKTPIIAAPRSVIEIGGHRVITANNGTKIVAIVPNDQDADDIVAAFNLVERVARFLRPPRGAMLADSTWLVDLIDEARAIVGGPA